MAYGVEFAKNARKELRRLPPSVAKRIIEKIQFYIETGDPLLFAQPLKEFKIGDYRFRIGNYRVIVREFEDLIVVVRVGHRKDVYRKK